MHQEEELLEKVPQTFQEVALSKASDDDAFPAQPAIESFHVNPSNIPPEFLPPQYRDDQVTYGCTYISSPPIQFSAICQSMDIYFLFTFEVEDCVFI